MWWCWQRVCTCENRKPGSERKTAHVVLLSPGVVAGRHCTAQSLPSSLSTVWASPLDPCLKGNPGRHAAYAARWEGAIFKERDRSPPGMRMTGCHSIQCAYGLAGLLESPASREHWRGPHCTSSCRPTLGFICLRRSPFFPRRCHGLGYASGVGLSQELDWLCSLSILRIELYM